MKKLALLLTFLMFGFAFVACDGANATTTDATTTSTQQEETTTTTTAEQIEVQGVTEDTIYVGNTAATSGAYAAIGVPFNEGIKAVFKEINDAGGIDGRTIEFITYDDGFDAATGKTYTETLIYEDEIFALVGHFGTPTVGATLDIIQEVGIPMVYAATGINALYFQESPGNPVMAVQPIYMTDGRIMAARAVKEAVYGDNEDEQLPADAKIGVVYTNDDVGSSLKEGIEIEAEILGKTDDFIYQSVTSGSFNTAMATLQASGVSAVLLAMNQEPFGYALTSMSNLGFNVPVFSSYVNADVTVVDHYRYNEDRPIYVNAWVDVFSTEGAAAVQDYIATINQADLDQETKTAYYGNSFAIAGYIAATVFVEGLQRVEDSGEELTWDNYIAAMEEGPIDIPMGGVVDFSGGKRWGIASMSLLQYYLGDNPATEDVVETEFENFVKAREIETLEEIESK